MPRCVEGFVTSGGGEAIGDAWRVGEAATGREDAPRVGDERFRSGGVMDGVMVFR
jgi:hypothetical protein